MSSSYRILVVGILGEFEAVLSRWFNEWGHEARFTSDPAGAHETLTHWLPHVVLVDHLQTPSDFETWWSELRSHPALATIPTIVTGNTRAGTVHQEAAAILRRPYTRRELEAAIARVTAGSPGTAS